MGATCINTKVDNFYHERDDVGDELGFGWAGLVEWMRMAQLKQSRSLANRG